MEGWGLAGDWTERLHLVWPFPCLGSNRLWGHIPVGIASCTGAVEACLLGSSQRWIQVAYGLTWLWRTIHRCKCRISLLWRQLLASLSMFAYLHSASVSTLLAKAMGLSLCRSAAPRPTCEASTCIVTGSNGSKYLKVVSLTMACLTHWKVAL